MSRHHGTAAFAAALLVAAFSMSPAAAQDSGLVRYGNLLVKLDGVVPGKGRIAIPQSSLRQPIGRARTHYNLLIPDGPIEPPRPGLSDGATPAATTSVAETPASLACVYMLVPQSHGCDPNRVSRVANGGSNVIAIVDAFHNPTAKADLQFFSSFYGLPAPNIQIVFCSASSCSGVTTPPAVDQGWAGEIALDVQAAHAMAPNAKIILVEAHTNSFTDLMRAVDRAKQLVAAQGGGQVSNSYGGTDDGTDGGFFASQDFHFLRGGVVFFASTGDHKGGTNVADVEWPSTSPNVVAVGGTTILRSSTTNVVVREQAWLDGGGGLSGYAARPSFQNGIMSIVGAARGVPDISADADPPSGMYVYCTPSSCGFPPMQPWVPIGGTSLASPLMAGIANAAGRFRASSKAELTSIYANLGGAKYNDITTGKCGNGTGGAFVNAVAGWDRCTGVGTPHGRTGL